MSRPAGHAFLGSKATTTTAKLGNDKSYECRVIIDSGSDITLVSHGTLPFIEPKPKIGTGQRVHLVQVTGKSTISGYVEIPVSFDTNDGPVSMNVEAYVVKGMNTPFLIGNDFAELYALSTIRKDTDTFLLFGDTGRYRRIENTIGAPLKDM